MTLNELRLADKPTKAYDKYLMQEADEICD